jgi:DNA-directed RNA polymerase specialized sigma24 family protein
MELLGVPSFRQLMTTPKTVMLAPAIMPGEELNLPALSQNELLTILDSDPWRAAEKYRELYQKLIRYFEWNRQADAEDLAQETLKRGFGRLQEGQKITIDDPAGYFFGIARNLLRERGSSRKTEGLDDSHLAPGRRLFCGLDANEQFVFLKECLGKLPREDFDLLSAYVDGEIKTWGSKAGVSPGTVRMRIHRIRKRLEAMMSSRGQDGPFGSIS